MRDAFLAFTYLDREYAVSLAGSLTGRGVALGEPLSLWPEMRLLKSVDQGLILTRHAVVIIPREFLHHGDSRRELDVLAGRERVVALMSGVEERDVDEFSSRLAGSAVPGAMAETLVRLLRVPGNNDYAGGWE